MNTTYTCAAHKTALVVLILTNGDRITTEIANTGTRKWLIDGLVETGKGLRQYRAYASSVVVIEGVDVYNYNANEAYEIFGWVK